MRKKILVVIFVLSILAASCGSSPQKSITIGSKDFTEQYIVAEMYAQLLEEEGFAVERKLGLGGTPVAQATMLSGDIDLYPEYTGTGLLTVLKEPVETDAEVVYEIVADGYLELFNFVWLDPAPMNNTQALAVSRSLAEERDLYTISDLAAQAGDLIMIGPAEFTEREDGLPGLKLNYGEFELQEYKAVEKGLRYAAIQDGQADVVVAFGTDGEIAAFDLIVLEDDQGMFPPYQVAPVINGDVVETYPEIADILNPATGLLTNEVMQQLNYQVSGEGQEPAAVAREFLVANGLLGQ